MPDTSTETIITNEQLDALAELLLVYQDHSAIAHRFKLTRCELGELVQTPGFQRRRDNLKALQALNQEAIDRQDDELSRAKLREDIKSDDPKIAIRAAIALQRAIRPPARSSRPASTLRNQAGAAPIIPFPKPTLPPDPIRQPLPLDPPPIDSSPDYLIEALLHGLQKDPANDLDELYKRLYDTAAFTIKTGQLKKKFIQSLEQTNFLKCSALEPNLHIQPCQITSTPPADDTLLPSLGTTENPNGLTWPRTRVILSATKHIEFSEYDNPNLTRKVFNLTFHFVYEQPFNQFPARWSLENITIPPPVPRPKYI